MRKRTCELKHPVFLSLLKSIEISSEDSYESHLILGMGWMGVCGGGEEEKGVRSCSDQQDPDLPFLKPNPSLPLMILFPG